MATGVAKSIQNVGLALKRSAEAAAEAQRISNETVIGLTDALRRQTEIHYQELAGVNQHMAAQNLTTQLGILPQGVQPDQWLALSVAHLENALGVDRARALEILKHGPNWSPDDAVHHADESEPDGFERRPAFEEGP